MTFETRQDIITALVAEFGERAECFSYNQSALRFWTYNRLLNYYLKCCKKVSKRLGSH
jgi:hypothetical protein